MSLGTPASSAASIIVVEPSVLIRIFSDNPLIFRKSDVADNAVTKFTMASCPDTASARSVLLKIETLTGVAPCIKAICFFGVARQGYNRVTAPHKCHDGMTTDRSCCACVEYLHDFTSSFCTQHNIQAQNVIRTICRTNARVRPLSGVINRPANGQKLFESRLIIIEARNGHVQQGFGHFAILIRRANSDVPLGSACRAMRDRTDRTDFPLEMSKSPPNVILAG